MDQKQPKIKYKKKKRGIKAKTNKHQKKNKEQNITYKSHSPVWDNVSVSLKSSSCHKVLQLVYPQCEMSSKGHRTEDSPFRGTE